MEQKKTLWIIAAVGIFLLVVLGGAAIVYRSSTKDSPIMLTSKNTEKPQQEWTNQPVAQANTNEIQRPGFDYNKVNDMFVVSENTTVYDLNKNAPETDEVQNQGITSTPTSTTIDLNALKKELTAEVAAATANQNQQPQNINITVTMPSDTQQQAVIVSPDYSDNSSKNTVKAEKSDKKEAPATVRPNKQEVQKQEAPKATTSKTSAAKTTPKKETAPAKATETKAATQTPKAVTRYWVQVAAYTNKKTAENAREVLTSNKITSDIFTYQDAKNRLFYRVRVGPYTTKSEAEYWQAKIAKIDDFKDSKSYVASTTD
ncbi:MAG: SPOR domain-containing protein [Treponema sp.]|nr:SPOR domain-containing protein [Treponema sp.]